MSRALGAGKIVLRLAHCCMKRCEKDCGYVYAKERKDGRKHIQACVRERKGEGEQEGDGGIERKRKAGRHL